jgi:Protein of unknown function (DUF2442)
MNISATGVRFDVDTMWVELTGGRTIRILLAWYPHLLKAKPAQREKVEISRTRLHWDALDENISVEGLLAGRRDITRKLEVVT